MFYLRTNVHRTEGKLMTENVRDVDAWTAEMLIRHIRHDVGIYTYGRPGFPENVALECKTCFEVVMDFDLP